MASTADRVTRVAADLLDSAAVEGAANRVRSAKQQLDHWARVGTRGVESGRRRPGGRVESALAGDLELRRTERRKKGVVFNAEIAAAVQEKLAESNLREAAWPSAGITTRRPQRGG